jgi:hypothetical protein
MQVLTGDLGEQLCQRREPGEVVADPPLRQLPAAVVDDRDVVMTLGPIDPAEDFHVLCISVPGWSGAELEDRTAP